MQYSNTTCVTCGVDAAGVGDGGYLGTAILSTKLPRGRDPEEIPFGYFYEALEGIGLLPRDVVEFREFLERHAGHKVVDWVDGTEDAELEALLEKRREDEEDEGEFDEDDEVESRFVPGDWTFGQYGVSCETCRKQCVSEESADLRNVDLPRTLKPKAVEMMLARWGKLSPDEGWNGDLHPIIDPYEEWMEGLLGFLKKHKAHKLRAFLVPAVG